MNLNYELSPMGFKRGVMIKHIGIPMYAGDRLITPYKVVWWWPVNWTIAILGFFPLLLKVLKRR